MRPSYLWLGSALLAALLASASARLLLQIPPPVIPPILPGQPGFNLQAARNNAALATNGAIHKTKATMDAARMNVGVATQQGLDRAKAAVATTFKPKGPAPSLWGPGRKLQSLFQDMVSLVHGSGQRNGLPPNTPQVVLATPQAAPVESGSAQPVQAVDPGPGGVAPPGTVPVDQVGLAAAGGPDGGGSSNGGIEVITSNPLSISNPIDLAGGNYNGNFNDAIGK